MRFQFLVIIATGLIALPVSAQKHTENFEIKLPEGTIPGSPYNSIHLIDRRIDTTNYGIVQLGAFNKKAKVIAEVPLEKQLSDVVAALIDNTAKDGKLVLLLRQFSLAETTGAVSERGYIQFRAILFGSTGGQFQELTRIDTVMTVGGLDVTRALLKQGGQTFTDFIKDHLTATPSGVIVADLAEIAAMDNIEKARIPAYTVTQYKTGAYKTWEAFANQQPADKELLIQFWKTGNVKSVQMKNKNGKFEEIDLDDWYAFIYQDKLYINTEFGIYPLERKDNDFYFTGKSRASAKAGNVIAAQFFFGIMGGLMASSGSVGKFEMKIDHLTGGFIHLREVK